MPPARRIHPLSVRPASRLSGRAGYSAGLIIIALLAVASSVLLLMRKPAKSAKIELWTFARQHQEAYEPIGVQWNKDNPDLPLGFRNFDGGVHERRILSSFRTGTEIGDLLEVHETIASSVFAGPLDSIGFLDLTERLEREGLLEKLNRPSFSPWTTRGRIFGLPHDVHPVLLAYRADLVEAAGIDVSKVETWDDFAREFAPLMAERDAAGRPTRYLLNFWPTATDWLITLLQQADGGPFLPDGTLALNSDTNVRILSRLATWCAGPNRFATDVPEFNASGNRLRVEGVVVASIMPDWLAGVWRRDLPELAGKVKLMPLPAWERGGRRTSVMGGTMVGIARTAPDPETAWKVAKYLYLNAELWDRVHADTFIIPPVRALWDRPVYHEPSPFFSGQKASQLFIAQAPNVPNRVNSPFRNTANTSLQKALLELTRVAQERNASDPRTLEDDARRILDFHQNDVSRRIARNVLVNR